MDCLLEMFKLRQFISWSLNTKILHQFIIHSLPLVRSSLSFGEKPAFLNFLHHPIQNDEEEGEGADGKKRDFPHEKVVSKWVDNLFVDPEDKSLQVSQSSE